MGRGHCGEQVAHEVGGDAIGEECRLVDDAALDLRKRPRAVVGRIDVGQHKAIGRLQNLDHCRDGLGMVEFEAPGLKEFL